MEYRKGPKEIGNHYQEAFIQKLLGTCLYVYCSIHLMYINVSSNIKSIKVFSRMGSMEMICEMVIRMYDHPIKGTQHAAQQSYDTNILKMN